MQIYDNKKVSFRIFKKCKEKSFFLENELCEIDDIEKLTGTSFHDLYLAFGNN